MLIECPECGREVSSGAQACSECAYPLAGSSLRRPPAVQTREGSGLELTKQILGRVEKQLERRVSDLEDRHIQQMADMEDQYTRGLAELEERLDFTERLLTQE